MKRYLLATIRIVTDRAGYLLRWEQLRAAVIERGGHAWIFAGADDDARFLEFIEWKQSGDGVRLIDNDVVNASRAELERFGVGAEQQWKEVDTR